MVTSHTLALTVFAILLHPVAAQVAAEGYESSRYPLPTGTTHALEYFPNTQATFDGSDLVVRGIFPSITLRSFSPPVVGSFLVISAGGGLVLGETSTGGIWFSSDSQPVATIPYNYDAVRWGVAPQNRLIVSARTGGPSATDNDLILVDIAARTQTPLGRVPGASGPLAVGRNGDLFYATASSVSPPPPGQTEILRFPRAVVDQAIATQQLLGVADAQVIVSGLDSATRLAVDGDGDLFFVDAWNGTVGEVDDAETAAGTGGKVVVDYTGANVTADALMTVVHPNNVFEPFQPIQVVGESELRILEVDNSGSSQIRVVQPQQPFLTHTAPIGGLPAGPFTMRLGFGPVSGVGVVVVGLPSLPWTRVSLTVPGYEQPLDWLQFLLQPLSAHFVTFNGNGDANLSLVNPGFSRRLTVVMQAAVLDAAGRVIGATDYEQVSLHN